MTTLEEARAAAATKTTANIPLSTEDEVEESVGSIGLDDLNNDPTLLDSLTPAEGSKLHLLAEKAEVALAGIVRGRLNSLHNQHTAAAIEE